jgi:hypothetical protein
LKITFGSLLVSRAFFLLLIFNFCYLSSENIKCDKIENKLTTIGRYLSCKLSLLHSRLVDGQGLWSQSKSFCQVTNFDWPLVRGYDKFNVIQTECIWNEIRKVLDSYYLCIQLSVIYVEFLDALVVCWRQNFLENDDFWKVWSGGKKVGEEGIFF